MVGTQHALQPSQGEDEGRHEEGLGTAIARRFKGIGFDQEIPELRGFPAKPPDLDR